MVIVLMSLMRVVMIVVMVIVVARQVPEHPARLTADAVDERIERTVPLPPNQSPEFVGEIR